MLNYNENIASTESTIILYSQQKQVCIPTTLSLCCVLDETEVMDYQIEQSSHI